MYESKIDWEQKYALINSMNNYEILEQQSQLIGKFQNNYCFTKRMAEELLVKQLNKDARKVPLVLVRPSIIAASNEEPVPGWVDSLGMLGMFYYASGHGILRDLPLNPKLIGDQIPVDFLSN